MPQNNFLLAALIFVLKKKYGKISLSFHNKKAGTFLNPDFSTRI